MVGNSEVMTLEEARAPYFMGIRPAAYRLSFRIRQVGQAVAVLTGPVSYWVSYVVGEEGLLDVDRGDAQCGKREGQRRAAYGRLARSHGLDGILPLGGRRGHLIEVSGAGE